MSNPSLTSIQTIQKAYLAYYGRPADHAGLNYWASVLDGNGGNLSALIQQFGNSEESRSLYSSASVAERVEKIYQQLFNRPADAGGKAWYVAEIEAGRMSLASAALNIMNGASGDDLPLIERKVVAAQRFTDSLRDKQMSHAYGEQDILPAREYLSKVSAGMSDAALQAHLDGTLKGVMNATWATFNTASNSGIYSLGNTDGLTLNGSKLLFGDTGRINYSSSSDVFIAALDTQTLQPATQVRLGGGSNELLGGLSSGREGHTLAWGQLDTSYNTASSKLSFVWKLDGELKPLAAVHLGGSGGNAPQIQQVRELSDGKYLVLGSQNTVSMDGQDAFAVVLNADFSVFAQKRFDHPATRGNESFVQSLELSDGSLILLGDGGELFRFDKSLNVLGERDLTTANYLTDRLYALGDDLFLAQQGSNFHVVDKSLAIKSYFTLSGVSTLIAKGNGEFLAYDSSGEFFNLKVDVGNPALPVITGSDYRILTTRDGYGVYVDKFASLGSSTLAIDNNHVFSFSMEQTPSPNLAADYRLTDGTGKVSWSYRVYENSQLLRSGWEAGDLQIVTIGVLPAHSVENGILEQKGLVAI